MNTKTETTNAEALLDRMADALRGVMQSFRDDVGTPANLVCAAGDAVIAELDRLRAADSQPAAIPTGSLLRPAVRIEVDEPSLPELVVTRGGIPVADQAQGIRDFKEACASSQPLKTADGAQGDEPPQFTERGFARWPATTTTHGADVEVYESSAASGPHIWLRVNQPAPKYAGMPEAADACAHMTLDQAREIHARLGAAIEFMGSRFEDDSTPPPPPPSDAVAPVADWEDPRVKVVYQMLCNDKVQIPAGEHWEGFLARRIIAVLDEHERASPRAAINPVVAFSSMVGNACVWQERHHLVNDCGAELALVLRSDYGGYVFRGHKFESLDDAKAEASSGANTSPPHAAATPAANAALRAALVIAEAALADIGDADREEGDNLAWAEHRAAKALPDVRAALGRPKHRTKGEMK